jgi:hypothetical protein
MPFKKRYESRLLNLASRVLVGPGCWPWTGAKSDSGYGLFSEKNEKGRPVLRRAHRLMYEYMVGPIPEGLTLDHLCRNRLCVRPSHLEPVTSVENVRRGEAPTAKNARKTHCPRGHEYNAANTILNDKGWRRCGICSPAGVERTHCAKGHEYTPDNLKYRRGWKTCIVCERAGRRRSYAKKIGKAPKPIARQRMKEEDVSDAA